jgi:hypothetical protein
MYLQSIYILFIRKSAVHHPIICIWRDHHTYRFNLYCDVLIKYFLYGCLICCQVLEELEVCADSQVLVARIYTPLFFLLSVYIFIFNKISLKFHLFCLNLHITSSCPHSCNVMLTATYMCRPYITLIIHHVYIYSSKGLGGSVS